MNKNCNFCGKEYGRKKKLLEKIEYKNDCWLFTKGLNIKGYGQFSYRGKNGRAHRISYKLFKGVIPNDLMVCHTCDVRNCVNPDHLFLGTGSDNIQDCVNKGRYKSNGIQHLKTHCPKGHEYSIENTRKYNGKRYCKKCAYENCKRKRLKKEV